MEIVTPDSYTRLQPHIVVRAGTGNALEAEAPADSLPRLRRYFDTDADARKIDRHLAKSSLLQPIIAQHKGIRIPGCWNGFELAVRAILGQQVTVKGATTLMNRLVTQWGAPSPHTLANAAVETIGLPAKRAETIRLLARAVLASEIQLDYGADPEKTIEAICDIPGLGPWTANYIAMRALHAEDAFPSSDLGLLKAAGVSKPKDLERLAEPWRPYRAYAAFYLWNA